VASTAGGGRSHTRNELRSVVKSGWLDRWADHGW